MVYTRIHHEKTNGTNVSIDSPYRSFLHGKIVRRQKGLRSLIAPSQNRRHKLPLPIELHTNGNQMDPNTIPSSQSSTGPSSQGATEKRILKKYPAHLTVSRPSMTKRNEASALVVKLLDSSNGPDTKKLITRLAEISDICINVAHSIRDGYSAYIPNYMVDECDELVRCTQSSQSSSFFDLLQLNCDVNDTISCPGCGDIFVGITSSTKYKERAYFRHCILKCPEYEKLALLRLCKVCKLIFVNENYYVDHLASKHSRKGTLNQ